MVILPLIPFFLGYVRRDQSNTIPSYLFQVRVDTLFTNKSGTYDDKGNAGLAFNLKCLPHKVKNLKCHIPKTIFYSPSTDPVHMVDNNVFTPSSLQFSRIRFRMSFDSIGAASYQILSDEKVKDEETLLDVYRFIGDHLSVGVNLGTKSFEFKTTELSSIGKCPTLYKISRDKAFNANNFQLTSFIPNEKYKLVKGESFLINKQRQVHECRPQYGFILGRRLWTDFIPTSNVIAELEESQTLITFSLHDFYTKSINKFELLNGQGHMIGYVQETINVGLVSIED
ncbi:uncharacterized protein LOC116845095 [Odontomachus brunneus]|uniref:uncharacterized protein LOC116845095 n=1 Tax=Odontomachus brunneus TaxID=486640 RepID=UPI0013F2367D|nr:uncharacterized protein LOC116845095 [Odontomachus brunneus]XP_032673300.1 uncharacterized protein LOC116845095 [Odontomachus brunneus]